MRPIEENEAEKFWSFWCVSSIYIYDLISGSVHEPVCQVVQEVVPWCSPTVVRPKWVNNRQWSFFLMWYLVYLAKMAVSTNWFGHCAELCACVGLRVGGCSCFSQCGLCSLNFIIILSRLLILMYSLSAQLQVQKHFSLFCNIKRANMHKCDCESA